MEAISVFREVRRVLLDHGIPEKHIMDEEKFVVLGGRQAFRDMLSLVKVEGSVVIPKIGEERRVSNKAEVLLAGLLATNLHMEPKHRSRVVWEYFWPKRKVFVRITGGEMKIMSQVT